MKSDEHSSEALLPFETLLEHLQRQGFHIGVEHHLRLRVLLDWVGDNCGPSELKTLLCPLFATNAEQQNLFYRTFDTLYPFLSGTEHGEVDSKPAAGQASQPGVTRSWPSLVARALVLLILVALVTWKSTTIRTNTKPRPEVAPAVSAASPPQVINPKPVTPTTTPRRRIRVAGEVQQTNLIRKVYPVYPPEARLAGAQDPVRFNAVIGPDGRVQNLEVVSGHPSLVEPASQAVRQWMYKPTLLDGEPVEVATQIEVSPPALPGPTLQPAWYSSRTGALQWIVVLVPILLWLSYEVYRFRRRRLLIRKAQGKTPPYTWPIRTDFAPDIYDAHDLAMVSRALHRRFEGESERLDVGRTVEASVAALGFPTFRYRKDSRLPEYLFLIDRASFRDHQAHLYGHLASVLRGQGLYVSAYFYDGDPRVCWSTSGAESLHLEQLQHTCAGHRLVLFGNGDQLLDAVTGRFVQWHGLLTAWPERALLTPEAPAQWGTREMTLATQFAIAPATVEGLLAVAGYFEFPSSMEFRDWDRRGVQGHIDNTNVTSALRRYLGEDAFQWLCACAIYPDLQWDLTLCLGALPAMAPGLVCEENIVKLLRLDWFRSGFMPDSLRRALITQLDPKTEQEVRGAIIGLLQSHPPPEGTYAAGSHQFQIAYQRYRNSPEDRKAESRLKNLLENLAPDEVMRDYAYLDAAESVSRSPLQVVLPRRLLKTFYPSGVPLFGMWASARVLLLAGVVLVSLQLLRVLNGPGAAIAVEIQTLPRDAAITVNGPVTSATMTGSGTLDLTSGWEYDAVVSRPGYKTLHEPNKLPTGRWKFTLDPEPVRLLVSTSQTAGKLFVDNDQKGELLSGKLDLEAPADGADHSVILRNGNTEILSFNFVAKLGETPRVRDLKPNDLFVLSSLGSDARVYSGSSAVSANVVGQGLFVQSVSAEAKRLSGLSISNRELILGIRNLPEAIVDAPSAPVLYVELNTGMQSGQLTVAAARDATVPFVGPNADTNLASLGVQSNVPTARLFVDGLEIRSTKPGNWSALVRKPGQHTVKVTAEGYDDFSQQVEVVKDKLLQLAVELKPTVVATSAFLVIGGGTPGAEVLVDGVPVRTLDTSGATRIEVTPQLHKIEFRKDHFDSPGAVEHVFASGQEVKLGANDVKLKEMGRLQFQVTPQDAQVSYRLSDHQDLHYAKGRDEVWVPEGKYVIIAEAAGYIPQSRNGVSVMPGQVGRVELKLEAEPKKEPTYQRNMPPSPEAFAISSLFEDPSQITAAGGWWKVTGPGTYAYLRAHASRSFNLTFAAPSKKSAGNQKTIAEWVVAYESDEQKIVYQLYKDRLVRNATFRGKNSHVSIPCEATDQGIQFFIVIEAGSVEVKSPNCKRADTYESTDYDFANGKIGIRRDIDFVIR